MKKYKLYAATALIVAPAVLFSGSGLSDSSLPAIGNRAQPVLQPNCPVEGGFGCFGSSRPSPVSFCRQLMQMFVRPGAS
jgi:hypothetical protein